MERFVLSKVMKRLFRLAVCAAAAAAAMACDKNLENAESVTPEPEEEVHTVTFTASLGGDDSPQSKVAIGIDADNGKAKVSFTAGDYIAIYSDNGRLPDVTLRQEDINEDGSATFTVQVSGSSNNYYACCVNKRENYTDDVIKTNINAVFYTKPALFSDIEAGRIPHAALASCSASSPRFSFKSVLTLFRFRIGDDNIKYAKFVGNNNEAVSGSIYFNCKNGTAKLWENIQADIQYKYASYARTDGIGKDYYIALPPGVNLPDGFTITLCDASDNVLYTRKTTKEFNTVGNKIYDLGVFGSQYERWQNGEDIAIAGVTYNKSTYGKGTLVKNGGAVSGGGVFFIQEVATASLSATDNNAVYISNDPVSRAKLKVSEGSPLVIGDGVLAFSRIDIETPSGSPLVTSSVRMNKIVFDDCKVTVRGGIMDKSSVGNSVDSVKVVDSDFIISSEDGYLVKTGEGASTISDVTLTNNVFWSDAPREFHVIKSGVTDGVKVGSICLNRNTFYNVDNGRYGDGLKPFFMLGLPGTLTAEANLVYSTSALECGSDGNPVADARTAYLFGYRKESLKANYFDDISGGVTQWIGLDVKVGGLGFYTTDVSSQSVTTSVVTLLQNNEMLTINEDPFTAIDLTSGTYQKKDYYQNYGAAR